MRSVWIIWVFTLTVWGVEKEQIDELVAKINGHTITEPVRITKNPFTGGDIPTGHPHPSKKRKDIPPALDGVINKKALVAGQLYRIGEKVNGYTLTGLSEKGATFMKNGMFYAVKLSESRSRIMIKRDQ